MPHTIYVESRQQKNKAQQRSVKSEQRSVKSEQIIAEDSNEGHSSDHCSLITDNSPKHLSVLCSLITHGVLRQQLTRHALQLAVHADVLEKVGLGAEADVYLLDVAGGLEGVGGDDALREALAADVGLKGTDLREHDALALEQVRLDELLGGGQHGNDVGLGGGGGKLDVLGEGLEVVVAGLDGMVGGVIDALSTLGIGALDDLISDRHD